MHALLLILGGIVIGLIGAAPIGPVNLICIRRTLACGPLSGFMSGLGAALGDGIFACITGFGLTAIAELIEGYSTPLKVAGGLMLLGFGLRIFRTDLGSLRDAEKPAAGDGTSLLHAAMSTFALTIANPATLFGFTAMFAGLSGLTAEEASFVDAALVVGGVVAGSVLWWFIVTTVTGTLHRRIDAGVMRRINHGFGIAVTGFGVVVLSSLAWQYL